MLGEIGLAGACEADLSALRYVSECVSRRAGYLCAAGLTALLKKMDYKVSMFVCYFVRATHARQVLLLYLRKLTRR